MVFTEKKTRNANTYYYRVLSIRKGQQVGKKRVYLGRDLTKGDLAAKEVVADYELVTASGLELIIPIVKKILVKNAVTRAGIFGSFAKGSQRKHSDVDIVIQPPAGIGFGFSRIQSELEAALHCKVDLVSYNGLSPYLKADIQKTERRIL